MHVTVVVFHWQPGTALLHEVLMGSSMPALQMLARLSAALHGTALRR